MSAVGGAIGVEECWTDSSGAFGRLKDRWWWEVRCSMTFSTIDIGQRSLLLTASKKKKRYSRAPCPSARRKGKRKSYVAH